jgi:hypothetical protein
MVYLERSRYMVGYLGLSIRGMWFVVRGYGWMESSGIECGCGCTRCDTT